jgi:hypothetical protein
MQAKIRLKRNRNFSETREFCRLEAGAFTLSGLLKQVNSPAPLLLPQTADEGAAALQVYFLFSPKLVEILLILFRV